MPVTDEHIKRINALSKKAKTEGLTEEEKAEQQSLRKLYIDSYRQNLAAHLDNTVIMDHTGKKTPLKRKKKV